MMKITTGERSMPPAITTIVANAAAMPTIATACVMFSRLRSLKKNSFANVRYRKSSSVTIGSAKSGRRTMSRIREPAPAPGARDPSPGAGAGVAAVDAGTSSVARVVLIDVVLGERHELGADERRDRVARQDVLDHRDDPLAEALAEERDRHVLAAVAHEPARRLVVGAGREDRVLAGVALLLHGARHLGHADRVDRREGNVLELRMSRVPVRYLLEAGLRVGQPAHDVEDVVLGQLEAGLRHRRRDVLEHHVHRRAAVAVGALHERGVLRLPAPLLRGLGGVGADRLADVGPVVAHAGVVVDRDEELDRGDAAVALD